MKTTHTDFNPIACHGCGKQTAISTKFGVPIACECGVSHTAIGVTVASGEDLPKPVNELTEADVAKMTPAEVLAKLKALK